MTKIERIKHALKIELDNVNSCIDDCEETINHFQQKGDVLETRGAMNRQHLYIHDRNTYRFILGLIKNIEESEED